MPLTSQDKKHLKSIGHHLKPVLQMGDKGPSDSFINELEQRLEDHELIKVRINGEDREQRVTIVDALCQACSCELVQFIGKTALFYRAAKKPNPKLSNLLRASTP